MFFTSLTGISGRTVDNMNKAMLSYIRSLKPAPHEDGMELVKKGVEFGKTFKAGRSRFITESNGKYSCYMDYKKDYMKQGKIQWYILLGLATLEEQCEAITELHRRSVEVGHELHTIMAIPSPLVGLPKEYRDKAPSTTSYVMETYDDYRKHMEAAPVDVIFGDHHLVTPNAIETTVNALKAGAPKVGEFSQFIWDHAGFNDDVKRYSDMVYSLGIMASKRDEMFTVETYLDDGFPGYALDCVSYIGYALLEHYICCTLCNARLSISYAGLLSEIDNRMAVPVALHKLLSTEEQPIMSYVNGSTNLQWDHDIHGNYGVSCQEMLFEILVEKHYKMGLGINPVSITEKIAVPTMQDLWEIYCAGIRTEEMAEKWEPFIDFSHLDKISDDLAEQGTIFFHNCLEGFEEAGIDINDPLELILTMKKFDPVKYEQAFHPLTYKKDDDTVRPIYPTVLGRQTTEMTDAVVADLKSKGYRPDLLEGKKVVLGSGDAHAYGLLLVKAVLSQFGADVISGGVGMDAIDMLDFADEEGTDIVAVSCHIGEALDYSKQLIQLAEDRGKHYNFFMGGKLNAILPGHSEPTEVGDMIEELGVINSNDFERMLDIMKDC